MLTEKEQLLSDFIEGAKGTPAKWGESDCTMWAAQWVELSTGIKVPTSFYNSRTQAYELIKARGSLLSIWDEALASVGIFQTESPELGDVAVCKTGKYGDVGLVFAHGGIAYWRAESGVLALAPRKIIKAWKVI